MRFVKPQPLCIRQYSLDDAEAVIALWESCGLTRPWNNPQRDIERKIAVEDGLFLVAETADKSQLLGSVMGGYDGHRGWINYLAVGPEHQRQGIARSLVEEIEKLLLAQGCPKINLQVRTGNDDVLAFYDALGFSVDQAVSMGKRLIPDN
ncbi:MAG: GNAT family acetyltransferase [Granulosicoccus sp.]